jgi:hypothetical protein
MSDLKVAEFPIQSKRELVSMLRTIADEIEEGEYGDPTTLGMAMVVLNVDGTRMIWGANADRDKVYHLFGQAQYFMNREDDDC